ncbi:membrane protein insertion efficiency factor YidD [Helicobacter sp.]|uniref:membrane protein insertion efficiency factor YidD n=1 Tax=Helicobacter sp. TaxID=218 RepID=UPI001988806C|nr:membrane protein insertion efficiency factor YidD [Helicobacter sp.]MBD5165490.1 membrane protein insertion efficiency factor YidD [Helicobacter sp.]
MLKRFCIQTISFYQYFISPSLGRTCRYYPSCSEYSQQVFLFQNPCIAIWKTLLRILSCNQFFKGGIAYLQVSLKIRPHFGNLDSVKYWLVPHKTQKYSPKNVPNGVFEDLQVQKFYVIKNYSKVSRV